MKVKLALNIGTADARRLELPKSQEGDVINVSQPVADELLKRGWATTEDGKIVGTPETAASIPARFTAGELEAQASGADKPAAGDAKHGKK